MELRQLKYFLKAQALMNFTEAAQALNISQSTLSQQIKQLEIDTDSLFFNRVGKRIFLTDAGKKFVPFAQKCVRDAEESMLMLRDLKDLKNGNLKIGVSYGLRNILVPAIKRFSEKYPAVQLDILLETSEKLSTLLAVAELDIVLSYQEEYPNAAFAYESLFHSDLKFVTAKNSAYAQNSKMNFYQLSTLPLAMPAKGYSTTDYVMHRFTKLGLSPDIRLTVNDIPTLIEIVSEGNLHTVLAEATILNNGNLCAIPIEGFDTQRTASIITLMDAYETEAMKRFREELIR